VDGAAAGDDVGLQVVGAGHVETRSGKGPK
jgi:hypothetical protein